jgi:preprotein translocase subunit YajC
MLILLSIIPILTLALISYFAISKRSSPSIRRAAVIALILLGVSMAVCAGLIFVGPSVGAGTVSRELPAAPVAAAGADYSAVIVFVIFFILFFGVIFYLTRQEQRRTHKAE